MSRSSSNLPCRDRLTVTICHSLLDQLKAAKDPADLAQWSEALDSSKLKHLSWREALLRELPVILSEDPTASLPARTCAATARALQLLPDSELLLPDASLVSGDLKGRAG
jgi:hypothetical protein